MCALRRGGLIAGDFAPAVDERVSIFLQEQADFYVRLRAYELGVEVQGVCGRQEEGSMGRNYIIGHDADSTRSQGPVELGLHTTGKPGILRVGKH